MKKGIIAALLVTLTFGAAAESTLQNGKLESQMSGAALGSYLMSLRQPPQGADAYGYFVPMMGKVKTESELGSLQTGCRDASLSLGMNAKTEEDARKGFGLVLRCVEVWETRSIEFCENRPFAQKKACIDSVKDFAKSTKRQALENANFYGVSGVK